MSLNCSRYLGEWIEKVKERANELSQQIRHNDLQLQKLSEEKQEALEHFSCWYCFDKFVCVCVCVPLLVVLTWTTQDICVCRFISSFGTMARREYKYQYRLQYWYYHSCYGFCLSQHKQLLRSPWPLESNLPSGISEREKGGFPGSLGTSWHCFLTDCNRHAVLFTASKVAILSIGYRVLCARLKFDMKKKSCINFFGDFFGETVVVATPNLGSYVMGR